MAAHLHGFLEIGDTGKECIWELCQHLVPLLPNSTVR